MRVPYTWHQLLEKDFEHPSTLSFKKDTPHSYVIEAYDAPLKSKPARCIQVEMSGTHFERFIDLTNMPTLGMMFGFNPKEQWKKEQVVDDLSNRLTPKNVGEVKKNHFRNRWVADSLLNYYVDQKYKFVLDDDGVIEWNGRNPDLSVLEPYEDAIRKATQLRDGQTTKSGKLPRLTRAQELELFSILHWANAEAYQYAHESLHTQNAYIHQDWIAWQETIAKRTADIIYRCNRPLVSHMYSKYMFENFDQDLMQEADDSLRRAMYGFDPTRGFKFSTYACQSIDKGFKRSAMKKRMRENLAPVSYDPEYEKTDGSDVKRQNDTSFALERLAVHANNGVLSDKERTVLNLRYQTSYPVQHPLYERICKRSNGAKHTLEQAGKLLGLTKERVRQVEHGAREKLRAKLDEDL